MLWIPESKFHISLAVLELNKAEGLTWKCTSRKDDRLQAHTLGTASPEQARFPDQLGPWNEVPSHQSSSKTRKKTKSSTRGPIACWTNYIAQPTTHCPATPLQFMNTQRRILPTRQNLPYSRQRQAKDAEDIKLLRIRIF